jgi:mannose-6-phosphate isomerase
MGAHPSGPSLVVRSDASGGTPNAGSATLAEAIASDPTSMLGPEIDAAYSGRLPYLLKILAAAENLSLQVHPDAAQARIGFETGAYVDPYPKPELLVAVETFDALCGFRHPDEAAAVLESFGVDALAPVVSTLRAEMPVGDRLRRAMELLIRWPAGERGSLVAAATNAGRSALTGALTYGEGDPRTRAFALAADLGSRYPEDVGVFVALLLNEVRLGPDEAVYMPAGNLHTYVSGVGVEVMAASDNVVRGGLTSKPVDVDELLRLLRYEVLADPVVRPDSVRPGVLAWRLPVREFTLIKATVQETMGRTPLPGSGPRIVVCLGGEVTLKSGEERVVRSGESVFVAASEPEVVASGRGVVFQAGPN